MSRPRSCSGDMNAGVPIKLPATVRRFARLGHGKIVRRQFRESEVQHLQLSARRDDDVLRLDVAMNDAGSVGRLQRLRRLDADVHHVGGR